MQRLIEKFYALLFLDETSQEEVPYANKAFMFYFSFITTLVVVFLIVKDILKNVG